MTAPATDDQHPRTGRIDDPAQEHAAVQACHSPLDVEASTWQARQQDGLTHTEQAELQAWLGTSAAHRAAFEKAEALWVRLGDLPADAVRVLRAGLRDDVAKPGHRPAARLDPGVPGQAPRPAQTATTPATRHGRRTWWPRLVGFAPRIAVAAAVCVVVGAGWRGWDHWDQWQRQPTYSHGFDTARGQLLEAKLPDGSQLKLDTATRAQVVLYRQRREVRLSEGQVMFSVRGDAGRPFDVLAGPLRITVVGTRFSVRHTRSGLAGGGPGGVSVVVQEGRVRVAPSQGGAMPATANGVPDGQAPSIELTAGQSVTADEQGRLGDVVQLDPEATTAWQEGRVTFNDTPLAQALAEFERYLDTRVVVTDPAVAAMRLNGSFDLRQFKAFTRALPQVLPVRLQLRPDGVTELVRAR